MVDVTGDLHLGLTPHVSWVFNPNDFLNQTALQPRNRFLFGRTWREMESHATFQNRLT